MTQLLNTIVNNKPLFIIILGSIALIIILLIILLIISNKANKKNAENVEETDNALEIAPTENISMPIMQNTDIKSPSVNLEMETEEVMTEPTVEPLVDTGNDFNVIPEAVETYEPVEQQQVVQTPVVEEAIIETPTITEEPIIEEINDTNIAPEEVNVYESVVTPQYMETPMVEQPVIDETISEAPEAIQYPTMEPTIEEETIDYSVVEEPIVEPFTSPIFEENKSFDNVQNTGEEIIDYELIDDNKEEINDNYDQAKNDLINELNNQKKEVEKIAATDEFLTTLESYKVK